MLCVLSYGKSTIPAWRWRGSRRKTAEIEAENGGKRWENGAISSGRKTVFRASGPAEIGIGESGNWAESRMRGNREMVITLGKRYGHSLRMWKGRNCEV